MRFSSFFKEDNGNLSFMRLLAFICIFISIVFGFFAIFIPSPVAESLSLTFISYAFIGKVSQKIFEKKDE